MQTADTPIVDGRHARRERGRLAVIEAMIDLVQEGSGPPSAEAIADRAGVSLSSLFRYFDGLADLQHETTQRFFERYRTIFEMPDARIGSLDERIDGYVRARVTLYETVAPMARLARARSLEHANIAATVSAMRQRQADQTRAYFADPLDAVPGETQSMVLDMINTVTSFEAWDVLAREFDRNRDDIVRTWGTALRSRFSHAVLFGE